MPSRSENPNKHSGLIGCSPGRVLTRDHLPQFDPPVHASGCQETRAWTESHRVHLSIMSLLETGQSAVFRPMLTQPFIWQSKYTSKFMFFATIRRYRFSDLIIHVPLL